MNKLLIFILSLLAVSLEAATITNWGTQLPTAAPAGGDVILMQKGGVTYYFTPNQLAANIATNASSGITNKIGNLNGTGTNTTLYGVIGIGTANPNTTFQVADFVNFSTTNQSMYVGLNSGDFPLVANTAIGNTVFGHNALTNITASSVGDNTAFGVNVLRVLTTGTANVGVGADVMIIATTAANNTAIGDASLLNLTTGTYNAVGGASAGKSITTGTDNALFGGWAGAALIGGNYNVAMGRDALLVNSSGVQNTVIGATSMKASTTGFDNATLGTSAGFSLITGNRNIFIGSQAASAATSGSSNIVIGYGAEFTMVNPAQSMIIGNLLYGTGLNGNGTNVATTGKIGIGTVSPARRLEVSGTVGDQHIRIDAPAGQYEMLEFTQAGSAVNDFVIMRESGGKVYFQQNAGTVQTMFFSAVGWVGFGTFAPASSIDATGQVRQASSIHTNSVSIMAQALAAPASTAFTTSTGAHLWNDGTNLCVVMQNASGTRTTNKLSMTAWP